MTELLDRIDALVARMKEQAEKWALFAEEAKAQIATLEAENAALRAEALRHAGECARHAADDRAVIAELKVEVHQAKEEAAALRAEVEKWREMYRTLWESDANEDVRESRAREARLREELAEEIRSGHGPDRPGEHALCSRCSENYGGRAGVSWPCDEELRARAALASGESREGETCWLIEAPAGAWGWQSVHWWCGQQEGGAEWTADATIAVRFLRREDAEAVLNFLTDQLIEVGGGVRVTEHVFLRRALASGESREDASIEEPDDDDEPASAGPAEEPGR